MSEASPSVLNQLFSAHLDHPEGKDKLAQVAQSFIRDKLRENSFARKILPPQMVTRNELRVSMNHDTMSFVDWVEPNSRAMAITFRGQPTARYIRGSRYEIPFFTISSERMEKTEQELMVYPYPITKVFEDNTVADIQEVEDYRFLTFVEAAVQATGQVVRGEQAEEDEAENGAGNGLRGVIQRTDLIELFKELDSRRRRLDKILINEEDWDDILAWTIEDNGDEQQGKVLVDGFTYDRIMGRKVIRTVKTDILQSGNIYGFTSEQWLGKFLVLNNTKFYIDKEANLLWWQAWEDIGIGIGNVASLAKLELYNGQGAGVDDSDTLIGEEEVGSAVYNQVDDGVNFPHVESY